MMEIKKNGDLFTLKFMRNDISDDFIQKLLIKVKIEAILDKSQMTKKQAWQLSEEIKENWWDKNRERILGKIGIEDD